MPFGIKPADKLHLLSLGLPPEIRVSRDGETITFGKPGSFRTRKRPVAEVTAATLETGADVGKRITATRLATLGVFALAAKKTTGKLYLTVSGEDDGEGWDELVEVSPKQERKAREFVMLLSRRAADPVVPAAGPADVG